MRLGAGIAVVVMLGVGLAASIGACTLLEDDPPRNTCKADLDCFTGIERCNLDAGVCEPKPDGGTP